jgi:hypothetical protein
LTDLHRRPALPGGAFLLFPAAIRRFRSIVPDPRGRAAIRPPALHSQVRKLRQFQTGPAPRIFPPPRAAGQKGTTGRGQRGWNVGAGMKV